MRRDCQDGPATKQRFKLPNRRASIVKITMKEMEYSALLATDLYSRLDIDLSTKPFG
jgi:hypothetical protein